MQIFSKQDLSGGTSVETRSTEEPLPWGLFWFGYCKLYHNRIPFSASQLGVFLFHETVLINIFFGGKWNYENWTPLLKSIKFKTIDRCLQILSENRTQIDKIYFATRAAHHNIFIIIYNVSHHAIMDKKFYFQVWREPFCQFLNLLSVTRGPVRVMASAYIRHHVLLAQGLSC